jgi:HEAT repeat protein
MAMRGNFKQEIEKLVNELGSTNPSTREEAAKALAQYGALLRSEALQPLIKALTDEDSSVRCYAAGALGALGDSRAIPALLNSLHTDNGKNNYDQPVKVFATTALGRIGNKQVFEELVALLDNPDPSLREAAADALGALGDIRAFEYLVALLTDKDYGLRMNAVYALCELGDNRAIQPLTQILKQDENVEVRRYAARWLYMLKDEKSFQALIKALEDQDEDVRYFSIESLGKLGDRRALPYLTELREKELDVTVKEITNQVIWQLS